MVDIPNNIWADGPAGNPTEPAKAKIRAWANWVQTAIDANLTNTGLAYGTRADLYADLAHPAYTSAWVISDSTAAYNGIYIKTGISGSGSWIKFADLPYSFVRMVDAGAGTANAIQVTSSISVPSGALRVSNIWEANTGNVTLSENGGTARPLVTQTGNQLPAAGLVSGMMIFYVADGTNYRIASDMASSAVQAAAENALKAMIQRYVGAFANSTAAEAYLTTFSLTKQTGTMFFNTTTAVLNYWDGAAWDTFDPAAPADGSITPSKIAPGYVLPRELPSGVNNFYVDPAGGSDLNDGSIGSKWESYEFGLRRLKDNFKWKAEPQTQVVINGEPGTTAVETIHNAPHGMIGAQGGAAVLIKGGAGTRIKGGYGGCYEGFFGSVIQFQDMEFEGDLTNLIVATFGAHVYILSGCKFFGKTGADPATGYVFHVTDGARVYVQGNCEFRGIYNGFVRVAGNGIFTSAGYTATLTGGIHSDVAFVHATTGGYAQIGTIDNTGAYSTTGKRFQATTYGHISTSGGATNLPGNSVGTADAGTFAIAV